MPTLSSAGRLAALATGAAIALAGSATANAATVPPPAVADNRVSAEILDPIPSTIRPPVLGQTCSGGLVALHAIPGLIGPLAGGDTLEIIDTLLGADEVTLLHLPGSPLLIATLPGRAGTLVAEGVGADFYITGVVCNGGGAPLEPHLFLTQVGNPLGAFEGSVTGSVGGSGSAEGSSIGLGSAEVGAGSADGMIELGSASGSDQGSTVDIGFHGSIADVSGSLGVDAGAGSSGSEAAAGSGQGSIDGASTGALDTSSLTGSVELPEGSSNGSSIDVGSIIPLAGNISDSVGDMSFPGS
ncbi:hypothetical protein ACWGLC_09115 [Dietzia sp. NPDC055877]